MSTGRDSFSASSAALATGYRLPAAMWLKNKNNCIPFPTFHKIANKKKINKNAHK